LSFDFGESLTTTQKGCAGSPIHPRAMEEDAGRSVRAARATSQRIRSATESARPVGADLER
jgi:hypothetical protein